MRLFGWLLYFVSSQVCELKKNTTGSIFLKKEKVTSCMVSEFIESPKTAPIKQNLPFVGPETRPPPVVLDMTRPDHREGMETSYKKQTCKQIYENKDLERDQRVEMMKTLSCHKMEFKNFDASLDPFLQADTSLGMQQLAEKFSDEEIKEAMEKLKKDPRFKNKF
ncbi:Oidioi.mRNA.OKI2018_I69.chr1.g2451.t1.cds [Oikopleura dioica]|uniref:Oidioi.mRNA.OKI2018_I69.chr1.g2451.t1.cds n=1 Tax=Oikopleura dioica TaxID=34765 RepID=A0ABN7SWH8_OIKDI|nr:Oidioi.mRNA.OKI2018_I69.chr1.g2451.t1.cds [Oikopleura dioica]